MNEKIRIANSIKLALTTLAMIAATSTTAFAGTWVQNGPSWSYTKDDGNKAMSEWITDSGKWYYLDGAGIMKTGWLLDNKKWYFMGSDGAMFVKQYTPKGYYCGDDGAWIENYVPDYGSSGDDSSNFPSSSDSSSNNSGQDNKNPSDASNPGRTDGPG